MSSHSVCNHTRNKQIGLPLRGRPILLITRIVQSIYYFNPSQIATEGFSSPFISLKYTDQHMKSLEKSKKGKIEFFVPREHSFRWVA